MRIVTALFFFAVITACGEEKTPPNPITVEVGTTVRFKVGNVEFTVNRFESSRARISIHNGNDVAVKIRVEGYDVPGVLVSNEFLPGGFDNEETPLITPGGTYNFKVSIWKSWFSPVTCRFISDTCFSSHEEGLLKF